MHPTPAFRHADTTLRERIIRAHPFATVFCATPEGPRAAQTPVHLSEQGTLLFHLARGNALTKAMENHRVLAVVSGPEAYISACWYSEANQVPTWNYVSYEFEGRAKRIAESELLALLETLSAQNEARVRDGAPWTMDKMDEAYRDKLMRAIVGFEMTIEETARDGETLAEQAVCRACAAHTRARNRRSQGHGHADARDRAVKLAVFDCDGTLVDGQADVLWAMRRAFERAEMAPPDPAKVRQLVGLSLPVAIRELEPEADEQTVRALTEFYKSSFRARREEGLLDEPLYPGIAELLHDLHASGWALAVATGKSDRGLNACLAAHGLTELFTSLQTADRHPSKPHPAMLEAALFEAAAQPHEAVMDRGHNL